MLWFIRKHFHQKTFFQSRRELLQTQIFYRSRKIRERENGERLTYFSEA